MDYGRKFELALAKVWASSGLNLVRMKITETGEERPCDERIDFNNFRVFNELKSTGNIKFSIKQLKRHQLESLYHWHFKFKSAIGLISIEFRRLDTVYIIDILTLIRLGATMNSISSGDIEEVNHFKISKHDGDYALKYGFIKYLKGVHYDKYKREQKNKIDRRKKTRDN